MTKKSKILGTFVFTDIVQSSVLWKKYPNKMNKAIQEHEKRTHDFVKKYKGIVIKTIGDSFMILFKDYKKAIPCLMEIQVDLMKNPIYLSKKNNHKIKIRAGMCTGEAFTHKVSIQGHTLNDYYGTVVNMASRMESKVSKEFQIAISFYKTKIPRQFLSDLAEYGVYTGKFEIEIVDFKDNCITSKPKRSERLLSYECRETSELKGVPSVKTFVIKFL